MCSKTANGLKKIRFRQHKAKRQRNVQKRKEEEEYRLASKSSIDRDDRQIRLTNRTLTLSQLIVPSQGNSYAKKEQVKITHRKKEQQKSDNSSLKKTVEKKGKLLENTNKVDRNSTKPKKNVIIVPGQNFLPFVEIEDSIVPEEKELELQCRGEVPYDCQKSKEQEMVNGTPLEIEIQPLTVGNDEVSLTKCSVDSGVDTSNGNSCTDVFTESNSQHSSFSSSSTKGQPNEADKKEEKEKNLDMPLEEMPENRDKNPVEQRVLDFVEQLAEQLQIQVISNEQAEPMLAPLKVEPLNLERIFFKERKRQKKPRVFKLMDADIEYCSYMEMKYGTDYEAMCRDEKNVFSDSTSSMERKLRIFKEFMKQKTEI